MGSRPISDFRHWRLMTTFNLMGYPIQPNRPMSAGHARVRLARHDVTGDVISLGLQNQDPKGAIWPPGRRQPVSGQSADFWIFALAVDDAVLSHGFSD